MTGAEALARLEGIGARIVLLPDEKIDITAPAGPETETLLDELARHKAEAVAVLLDPRRVVRLDEAEILRRRVSRGDRTLRELATRTCGTCGGSWWGVSSRGDAWCVACWRETRKSLSPIIQAPRSPEGPARSIPPEASRPGSAA